MNNEWIDLPTIIEVATAVAAGMDIEVRYPHTNSKEWVLWAKNTWYDVAEYRASLRKTSGENSFSPADRAELGIPEHLDPIRRSIKKNVKMLCWCSTDRDGSLVWRKSGCAMDESRWKRLPDGDIEGEVEA